MLTDVKLFNYYRRYIWNAVDFDALQATLIGYPSTLLAALCQDAVLSGLNQDGFTLLNANYLAGVAINSLGNLLAVAANGSVAVTNNVNSLIVVRPATANTNPITRPTPPFDSVYLNTEQTCSVVAIAGTLGVYPAKAAGDVILFGVVASGGAITFIDESRCELIGKSAELKTMTGYDAFIGNHRQCSYLSLADAFGDSPGGKRFRVLDDEVINAPYSCGADDVVVEFAPGVEFSKGTSATGFNLGGSGIKFIDGRFINFSTGGDVAINISGNYSSIIGARFFNNDTDVVDGPGTSQQVGVINE